MERENHEFSSDSIFDEDQLQVLLSESHGYLVDEVSASNMVFAFEDTKGAIQFCAMIQKSMAIYKSKLRGLGMSRTPAQTHARSDARSLTRNLILTHAHTCT